MHFFTRTLERAFKRVKEGEVLAAFATSAVQAAWSKEVYHHSVVVPVIGNTPRDGYSMEMGLLAESVRSAVQDRAWPEVLAAIMEVGTVNTLNRMLANAVSAVSHDYDEALFWVSTVTAVASALVSCLNLPNRRQDHHHGHGHHQHGQDPVPGFASVPAAQLVRSSAPTFSERFDIIKAELEKLIATSEAKDSKCSGSALKKMKALKKEMDEFESEHQDRISYQLMNDPVVLPESKQTYDRDGIRNHILNGRTFCPYTGKSLMQSLQNLQPDIERQKNIETGLADFKGRLRRLTVLAENGSGNLKVNLKKFKKQDKKKQTATQLTAAPPFTVPAVAAPRPAR